MQIKLKDRCYSKVFGRYLPNTLEWQAKPPNTSIRRPYKPAQACAYQGLNEVVSDYKYVLRVAP